MWNPIRDIWIGLQMAWRDPVFHVVLAVAILFFLGLSMFASSSRGDDLTTDGSDYVEDRWGFAVPPDCRKDLSWIPMRIRTINLIEKFGVPIVNGLPGRRLGFWQAPGPDGVHNIFVDESITNRQIRREVINHEACHALWYIKYGHAGWHAE